MKNNDSFTPSRQGAFNDSGVKKTNSKTVKFDSEPRVTAEGTKLKTSDSHNGDMISNTFH